MNENKTNYEIDALQIISMLLKRWWAVVLAALLCAGIAFGYTKLYTTPTYEASAVLLINGGNSITTTYQEIMAGKQQSKDYPYILEAALTLDEAAEKLNSYDFSENNGVPYRTYDANVLNSMISSEAVEDSRIFIVKVTSTDPNEARIVANTIVEVFPEKVESLIRGGSVGVVDLARTPTAATSAGYSRNVVLGFCVGLILGVAYAIIMGLTSDVIESEDWLISRFKDDIPLLATIPDSNSKSGKAYYKNDYRKYGYYTHRES